MKRRTVSHRRVLILCEGITEEVYAKTPHLQVVFEQVEKHGFHLAFTAISLEYWFILHFEDCGKAFRDGEECLKHLKKLWPIYHKTKLNHFEQLGKYVDQAIDRAERRENRSMGTPVLEQQPYTSVHKLIAFFKALGRKPKC